MSHTSSELVIVHNWLYIFQSQSLIFVIQECRKQVEKKECYELQLVMAMVMGCQWDGAMLALKSQQLVMLPKDF